MQPILRLSLAGCLLLAAACGGPRNAPVDAAIARDTLRTALDSWKKGDPADALQKASPAIYVIDPDWQDGARLLDFEVVGSGDEKDAHLFSTVRLRLRLSSGQEVRRDAVFVVSTAPNRTVTRKLF
ncbi:MAG: hypothetical protein U0840_23405 [Gemmataceae bacterium]